MSSLKSSSSMLRTAVAPARHAARRTPASSLRQASTSTASTSSAVKAPGQVTMRWEDYFKLRRSRRTWGTVAAVPTTLAGVMFGGGYFANLETDPNSTILGLEPIYAYGIAVLGCVGLGWLSGPVLGNTLWRLSHRNVLSKMESMDNVFLRHVQNRRVDPSRQSVYVPVPSTGGVSLSIDNAMPEIILCQTIMARRSSVRSSTDNGCAIRPRTAGKQVGGDHVPKETRGCNQLIIRLVQCLEMRRMVRWHCSEYFKGRKPLKLT